MLKLIAKLVRLALVSILLVGLFVVAPTPRALAATINVTTTNPNVNLGDGQCSLIEAINEANTTGGSGGDCAAGSARADTIELGAGATYTLTGVDNGYASKGDNGLPVIVSTVTINGNNATISRPSSGVPAFRFFFVEANAALTLNQLALVRGVDSGANNGFFGGGGIHNLGTLLLNDSSITGSYSYYGGGIWSSGAVTITNSTLSANTADIGGGLYNNGGTVAVVNSIFSGNSATTSAAGIFSVVGALTVTDSTFASNTATFVGGGIYSHGPGVTTITNSTFSGNHATNVDGGGFYKENGTATITNSTFSGNSAGRYGGGIHGGTITITNSTFSGNAAQAGGGISNGPSTTIRNTIVANNVGQNCRGTVLITDGGNNLQFGGDSFSTCGATIPVADPLLGPLADNGGPTPTHALLPGSPAIDAGNNATCAAAPVNNLDQRGVKRPQGLACDIGAFEFQLASPDPNFPASGNTPPTARPLFDWNSVGEATSYTLQISTNQNFTTLALNTIITPSAYVLPTDLPRNTLLFWRVRANRPGEAGPWSRVRHFFSANPPGVPVLLAPAHSATVSNQPTLDWSDVTPAASYYEVQISTDANFATILGRGQGGRVNFSAYTPEAALGSGPFFWRVRAVSGDASGGMQFSQWSAARSFNVTPP